jgi:ATP-dependent Clp protease ATP-binding subunit ClpA
MMFERFSKGAREVVMQARSEAEEMKRPQAGTEHLLLGLLADPSGVPAAVLGEYGVDRERVRADLERLRASEDLGGQDAEALRAIGIDLDAVRARIEETFGEGALRPQPTSGRRRRRAAGRITPRAKKVLELALRETIRLRHRSIEPGHLLLGIIREREGLAARVLTEAGVDLEEIRRRTIEATGNAA